MMPGCPSVKMSSRNKAIAIVFLTYLYHTLINFQLRQRSLNRDRDVDRDRDLQIETDIEIQIYRQRSMARLKDILFFFLKLFFLRVVIKKTAYQLLSYSIY